MSVTRIPYATDTSEFSGYNLSVFAKSLNLRTAVYADLFEQCFQVQLGWLTVSSFKVQLNSRGLSWGWVLTLAEFTLDLSGCFCLLHVLLALQTWSPVTTKEKKRKWRHWGATF